MTRRPEIPYADRDRHVYIAGATRHGKSTLMERMILQDIWNNTGVGVLDPKGDLVASLLDRIPRDRADDVVLLDAADPVPVDFMSCLPNERQSLATDIFDTFMRFSKSDEGDVWSGILGNTVHALLAAGGCCFLDIHYFHALPAERAAILRRIRAQNHGGEHDLLLRYWEREFPELPRGSERPILTRMVKFIHNPALRTLLGCAEPPLKISELMENRKILLAKLSGAGKGTVNLIGSLLVSKIQQSAFRRERQRYEDRIPWFLYADEFQDFQTSDFDVALSQLGGMNLCLTLANQGFYQLDQNVLRAVSTNVTGARIAFRIDAADIPNWRHLCGDPKDGGIDPVSLANLHPYEAFYKIGNRPPEIRKTLPPYPPESVSCAQDIRDRTRREYYRQPDKKDLALTPNAESDDIKPATLSHFGERAGKPPRPRRTK